MGNILDVRGMAPMERHPKIFEAYNGLKNNGHFILVNDHEPKPLLYQFQAEHDGEFDWWYLEAGPKTWRVTIAKRAISNPKRTVTEYFETDHKRLDGIYGRFLNGVKEKRWEDAAADFREFSLGLRRHIRIEEDILFPVFEEKTGMRESGPTFVMKMEHKEIHSLLEKIINSTDAKDADSAENAARQLANILSDHNMKEEHILYPESDAFLTETERANVVKKGQALNFQG